MMIIEVLLGPYSTKLEHFTAFVPRVLALLLSSQKRALSCAHQTKALRYTCAKREDFDMPVPSQSTVFCLYQPRTHQ